MDALAPISILNGVDWQVTSNERKPRLYLGYFSPLLISQTTRRVRELTERVGRRRERTGERDFTSERECYGWKSKGVTFVRLSLADYPCKSPSLKKWLINTLHVVLDWDALNISVNTFYNLITPFMLCIFEQNLTVYILLLRIIFKIVLIIFFKVLVSQNRPNCQRDMQTLLFSFLFVVCLKSSIDFLKLFKYHGRQCSKNVFFFVCLLNVTLSIEFIIENISGRQILKWPLLSLTIESNIDHRIHKMIPVDGR